MAHPTYKRSQGVVDYPGPQGQTVNIAGKPRKGIRRCSPEIEDAWIWADRTAATPRNSIMRESENK